jgi:hypothetical protein
MKVKYLKIEDIKSLIIFIICVGILVNIPVYWFVLVPPALELQEFKQDSATVTGYLAPGGYFSVELDLGKDSIQGLHNGALFIAPHITNSQNMSLWQPIDTRVDEWPGTKSEIKYSSNDPINKRMVLNIDRINIPNSTELKGKTVPITIDYSVNYPVQMGLTEVLGGTITNFDVKTELIEKNISVALKNQVITQRDMDIVAMNEPWKKIVSLVIWIITLIIVLLVFTTFKFVENFKKNSLNLFKKIFGLFRKVIRY